MKSFLIIGMNAFGHHLCRQLFAQGCEVMIADRREAALNDALEFSVSAKLGDCTDDDVLRSFGVSNFDCCFVCLSESFQDSLQITSLLKELGAKKVISKAENDVHAKFLLRNGADSVIYPELQAAQNLAVSESSDSIFDCIHLGTDYYIYEISPRKEWLGKSLAQLDLRMNHRLNVLAIKCGSQVFPIPDTEHIIDPKEHLVVLSHRDDIGKVI